MAECILLKSGSSIGSDDCTAKREHVLEGYRAITKDSSDEPEEGTMKRASASKVATLTNADGRPVMIGKRDGKSDTGWHVQNSDGIKRLCMEAGISGYFDKKDVIAISEDAVAEIIGLTADRLWPGNTVLGITSGKTSLAGGTYTPKAAQQIISCSGKAMTGNIIILGDSNLVSGNIKKGVDIFGIPGGFEGWITEDRVIDFNANIGIYGIYNDTNQVSGAIWTIVTNSGNSKLKGGIFQMPFPLIGYKELIVEYQKHNPNVESLTCGLYNSRPVVDQSFSTNRILYKSGPSTITLDVRKISDRPYVVLGNTSSSQGGYNITRIYAKKYNE